MAKGKRHNRGFTLIELLVVVAIIAILASLLLPALSKARFTSQDAVCKSNLRQMMLAAQIYVSTYDRYPPFQMITGDNGQATTWIEFLDLGAKSMSTIRRAGECPLNVGLRRITNSATANPFLRPAYSYPYNSHGVTQFPQSWLGLGGFAVPAPPGIFNVISATPENAVVSPSQMVAFGDAAVRVHDPKVLGEFLLDPAPLRPYGPIWGSRPSTPPFYQQTSFKRHRGIFNRVYCDGHVGTENMNRPPNFSDDYLRQWNVDNRPNRDEFMATQ